MTRGVDMTRSETGGSELETRGREGSDRRQDHARGQLHNYNPQNLISVQQPAGSGIAPEYQAPQSRCGIFMT